jgi:hypothetical protein
MMSSAKMNFFLSAPENRVVTGIFPHQNNSKSISGGNAPKVTA